MTRLIRLLLPCVDGVPGRSLPVQQAQQFSPAQRAEIVQIMRDALKKDPSILRDAVSAIQDEDSQQQQAKMASLGRQAGIGRRPGGRQPDR